MLTKLNVAAFVAGLGLAVAASAGAQAANLVTNGNFELTSNGAGQLGYNTSATDWTTNGYNFVFNSGSADTTGVTGQYGSLQLWGPHDGATNGMPASSPTGGNYIGADGAYNVGAIMQTINGLTVGAQYILGFWWAGAQQYTYTGLNTEQWVVSLGSQTDKTAVYDNTTGGFSGWMYQTFTFTASSTSEVLSFLAVGTPNGVPPFSLLDGVSLNAANVPEPASMALLGIGVVALGGAARRRLKARAAR